MPLKTMLSINEQNQVKAWLEYERQGEQFPVDFDIAWVMAGYAMKHHAKRRLTNQSSYLVKDEDYKVKKESVPITQSGESTILGRSSDQIVMTCDAFKHFCLMAQTAKGREIRQYFIEAEKCLHQLQGTGTDLQAENQYLWGKVSKLKWELDNIKEPFPCSIPKKFYSVCSVSDGQTEIYTLMCKTQHGDVALMNFVIPQVVVNETEFWKYSALKRATMAPWQEFITLLNRMSQHYIPAHR